MCKKGKLVSCSPWANLKADLLACLVALGLGKRETGREGIVEGSPRGCHLSFTPVLSCWEVWKMPPTGLKTGCRSRSMSKRGQSQEFGLCQVSAGRGGLFCKKWPMLREAVWVFQLWSTRFFGHLTRTLGFSELVFCCVFFVCLFLHLLTSSLI